MQQEATATRAGDSSVLKMLIPLAIGLLYTGLFVWALMTGDSPDGSSMFGYGAVIGSGLTAAWYEHQKRRPADR